MLLLVIASFLKSEMGGSMFKRTFLAVAAGAAMVLGSMGSANALEITAGNYKITFDNYDVGTTGYGNTAGVKCTTVAECNAISTNQANGSLSDTAGILSVASINNISNGVDEYIRGTASSLSNGVVVGPYLTGIFSGLNDFFVEVQTSTVTGASTTALATGGMFSIFSNSSNYAPEVGPTGAGSDLDALQYAGISDGVLFLSGMFANGAALAGNDEASYVTTYKNTTLAGNGQGFLDFTGGVALSYFDTNKALNVNGGYNDAFLTVTYDDSNGVASRLGWDVKSVGQIAGDTQEVPEPGSIALISLAMLGMGAVTRRRNKQGESNNG